MRLILPSLAMLGLAVGCSATVNGTLVDGMNDQPIPGKAADAGEDVQPLRVIAKAKCWGKKNEKNMMECTGPDAEGASLIDNSEAGLTCLSFTADVDEKGNFSLSGLCTSKSMYMLSMTDKNLFLAETSSLEMGMDASQPLTLRAWRAPSQGQGVFLLADGELKRVASGVNFKKDKIWNSEEEIMHPEELPKKVPLIAAGNHLVITGKKNVAELTLLPLYNSEARKFGDRKATVKMDPWVYLGVEFSSDTDFERKTVSIDSGKVSTKDTENHSAKFIQHDAVPAGRYALMKEGAERALAIVDFGKAGTEPGPAEGDGG